MIKIISKKEYDILNEVVQEQEVQIETLIGMVKEANANTLKAHKCYSDLTLMIYDRIKDLPPEIKEAIEEFNRQLTDES